MGAPAAQGQVPFDELLARAELERPDLAIGLQRDWLGSVSPGEVPFVLPHLEATLGTPLELARLGNNLLAAAEAELRLRPEGPRMTPLLTVFALQPRLPGFRGFELAVAQSDDEGDALSAALAALERRLPEEPVAPDQADGVDRPATPEVTAGPNGAVATNDPFGPLSPGLRPILADLLAAFATASLHVELSWRRIERPVLAAAAGARDLAVQLPGGAGFSPAVEDAAQLGDDTSRAFAFLLVTAALEQAAARLAALEDSLPALAEPWQVRTPLGRVVVAGARDDHHRCDGDCLLLIDLGGDDRYEGSAAGAEAPAQWLSAVLDLGGDDRYQAGEAAAQGAGRGGIGVLLDAEGDDEYHATSGAQGFGQLGYGLLWDRAGTDLYRAESEAQGSGLFGAGLLVDEQGADRYRLLGEGQGFGGPMAVGGLIDAGGEDVYYVEPDPAVALGRADYHSDGEVAANNAQGAGVGRRGDLTDGHVWAGGLGVLVDLEGNDRYEAGNFAQGMGYWLGTGMLLDGAGDDIYRSVYFTQGSGAHYALGLLYDRSGDDRHLLGQTAGASLAYGWDFAVGMLIDGGGNDLYAARQNALGTAALRSLGLFLELGGDDGYQVPEGAQVLGSVHDPQPSSRPSGPIRSATTASQVGLFVDLNGTDRYLTPEQTPLSGPADRTVWSWPAHERGAAAVNRGAGLDLEQPTPESLEWLVIERAEP